jgi:hypothetical protein
MTASSFSKIKHRSNCVQLARRHAYIHTYVAREREERRERSLLTINRTYYKAVCGGGEGQCKTVYKVPNLLRITILTGWSQPTPLEGLVGE